MQLRFRLGALEPSTMQSHFLLGAMKTSTLVFANVSWKYNALVDNFSCQGQLVSFVVVLVQLMVNRRLRRLLQALALAVLTSLP